MDEFGFFARLSAPGLWLRKISSNTSEDKVKTSFPGVVLDRTVANTDFEAPGGVMSDSDTTLAGISHTVSCIQD